MVPAARPAVPVAVAVPSGGTTLPAPVAARAAAPAAPRAVTQPLRSPARTSRLAVASLICSIGSFLVIPFGFIPGIICGHMAKKRIARDSTLAGRGLAKAGLIVGYASLGVQCVALVAFLMFVRATVARQMSAALAQNPPMARDQRERPSAAPGGLPHAGAKRGPADTTPDAAGWTLQLKSVRIPDSPVSGRVKGSDFVSEKTSLQGGLLKFARGAEAVPDLEMEVALPVTLSGQLSEKTFTVPSKSPGGNPKISMQCKQAGKDTPEEMSWMEGYAMKLEFGKMLNGRLPGKIYLCVPDEEKSFVRGTFEVPLRRERGGSAVPPLRPATAQP